MNTRARFSWTELPQELLEIIAKRLETRDNVVNFKAVCKDWRRSAPSTALLSPLLPYYLGVIRPELSSSTLVLVSTSVCLLRPVSDPSAIPWFVTVEQFGAGKVLLRRLLSRSVEASPKVPSILDLEKLHVTELFKGYYLRSTDSNANKVLEKRWFDYNISKVVLFDKNLVSNNTPASIDDCTVFVLYNHGKLLAIRLGKGETFVNLKVPGLEHPAKFDDIVKFKGMIYAIDRKGKAYTIDHSTLKVEKVVGDPIAKGKSGDRKKWLVSSSTTSELYLISRFCTQANHGDFVIKLYELDEHGQCWRPITSLGKDRILFVTYDGCFFASIKDYLTIFGSEGDRIVFYRGSFSRYNCTAKEPDARTIRSNFAVYCLSSKSCLHKTSPHLHRDTMRLYSYHIPEWVTRLPSIEYSESIARSIGPGCVSST